MLIVLKPCSRLIICHERDYNRHAFVEKIIGVPIMHCPFKILVHLCMESLGCGGHLRGLPSGTPVAD
ncbi:hypothetical protein HanIR_Chr07g0303661 [Helianthus annuus]|nr:hypothetical protein HanIR_Chr07g0303661 [Helianthus annuus]